jgi:hypothetical protein
MYLGAIKNLKVTGSLKGAHTQNPYTVINLS